MAKSADFLIIGAGLQGLCTAYALLKSGASVRLVEARADVALETSFANAGMVHASLADPWNKPGVSRQIIASLLGRPSAMQLRLKALPSLGLWGLKFLVAARPHRHAQATRENYALAELSRQTILDWRDQITPDDDYQGPGLLKFYRDEASYAAGLKASEALAGQGLRYENLTPAQVIDFEPVLAPIGQELKGGLYYPDDFKADAHAFCQALKTAILAKGGQFDFETRVRGFLRKDDRVIGVRTDKGEIYANSSILCAGPFGDGILRTLGRSLPVRPVKGYSLHFDGLSGPRLPVVDDSLHCAFTPLYGGLRIAGTAEICGFDHSESDKALRTIVHILRTDFPELAENVRLGDAKVWHGFRPVSADGKPLIGQLTSGLFVNTGHGHMGWTFSAGSARVLADMLLGRTPPIDAHPFRPNR